MDSRLCDRYRAREEGSFNSIEWIPGVEYKIRASDMIFTFNSIEWIRKNSKSIWRGDEKLLSIPLNGFGRLQACENARPATHFQFHWMDSPWTLQTWGRLVERVSFNSIEWIPTSTLPRLGYPITQTSFNSIEWILHHRVPCSLWKVLSFPLRGFYSIKPPGGGSMYMV